MSLPSNRRIAQYWHGASERLRAMELANKFNKAEAEREREREYNYVGVGAVSMHHLRSAMPSKQAKQPICPR